MKKQNLVIIVLSVILFGLIQYVIFDMIGETVSNEMVNSYQSGYNQGILDSVNAIYQQTENCNPTFVTIGNLSKEVIDFSCVEIQIENISP
jgi:hypothetical protein